ncbi:GNAT family N-acetyltransferase [Kribbella sp. CA-253562]|uniref:GNAT family N-acetyltransferase n=1 Tax=Kribbella sp. CA-253562 TaxID=3239942 RepID=UPI003D8DA68F
MNRRGLLKLGMAAGGLLLAGPATASAAQAVRPGGDAAHHANRGWLSVTEALMRGLPRTIVKRGSGSALLVSFQPQAAMNGVFGIARRPDLREIERFAEELPVLGVPWVLRIRGEAGADFVELAARFGKTALSTRTLTSVSARDLVLPGTVPPGVAVRAVTGAQSDIFRDIAVRATGVPESFVRDLLSTRALSRPEVRPYVVEVDGRPAAIGAGFRAGEVVAPYYLFTLPEYAGRELDRQVAGRILRDAFAAGARTAVAAIGPGQEILLPALGFRPLDTWTTAA